MTNSGSWPALGNIGVVYSIQGNHARAFDYYQKSLAMMRRRVTKWESPLLWAISVYSTVSKATTSRRWSTTRRAWR